jgi:hypothetical protein
MLLALLKSCGKRINDVLDCRGCTVESADGDVDASTKDICGRGDVAAIEMMRIVQLRRHT